MPPKMTPLRLSILILGMSLTSAGQTGTIATPSPNAFPITSRISTNLPLRLLGPAIDAQVSQGVTLLTGVQSPHGELLTWPQSTTPGITSNALYCGTTSGNYTLSWTFPSPTISFDWLTTDSTNPPVQGQTYFCAVTASIGGIASKLSPEYTFPFPTVPVAPAGLSGSAH